MRISWRKTGLLALMASALPAPALAQFAPADSGLSGTVTIAGLIALLAVIPGLALLAAARRDSGDAGEAIVRTIAAAGGITLLWCIIGFSLAFAPGSVAIGGFAHILLAGGPDMAVVLIELAFALTAGGIIAQAGGRRIGFGWSIAVAIIWVLLVYAPLTWWLRGEGWLAGFGALDEGGGLTLHLAAGVSAYVLGIVVARTRPATAVSDPVTAAIGGGMVWLGLLALLAGATATLGGDAAGVLVRALVAAASGALVWLSVDRIRTGSSNPAALFSGGIAGIASVAAGAAYIGVAGAIIAGSVAGGIGVLIARASDRDGALATHGVGGLVGTLLLAFLFLPAVGGVGFDGEASIFTAFAAEAVAIIATILWSALISLMIGYATATVLPASPDLPAGTE